MKNRILSILLLLTLFVTASFAQKEYYTSIDGVKGGATLKDALHNLIKNHTKISYGSGASSTWGAFYTTDAVVENGQRRVLDMYSPEKRYFGSQGDAVGGMNIEHSVPKSWWGGTKNNAYCDLHHLNPSDQNANSRKSNYPLGELTSVSWDNGVAFVGKANINGSSTNAFEPCDEYKGDFARTYMYMFTCYQDLTWETTQMNYEKSSYPTLKPWAVELLLKWHKQDPVSEKEVNRNNAVYAVQGNRNPFVDYPQLAHYVWGDSVNYVFHLVGDVEDGNGGGYEGGDDSGDKNFIFEIINGVNTLTGYIGNNTNVVLPKNYNGGSYVIGRNAFYNNTSITSVEIPNSVTSIGESAFEGCSGLTSIVIGNGVTSIGDSAFNGCTSLKNLRIEDGEETLSLGYNYYTSSGSGEGLFYDCPLETLYLGRDLSYNASYFSGYSPFYNKTTLKSVTIGNNVTSIGERTFYNCSGLTSVVIGNGVTSIGKYAFQYCSALTNVEFPNSIISIEEYAFKSCSGLTSIVFGNSVTSIGKYAFQYCSALTSIVIPNSVTSIGEGAFNGCNNLKTVINFSLLTITKGSSGNGYIGYLADKIVNAPNGVIEGDFAFCVIDDVNTLAGYIGNGTVVVLPDNYKGGSYVIGTAAFYNNTSITSIVIPSSVTSIEGSAFEGCSGLTSVVIGNSVTSIGDDAFEGCSGLTSIVIPNSVTSIGNYAFYYCKNLTSVVIGNSVTSIGDDAFYGCSGLTSIVIPNSVTSIGNYAFNGCTSLKDLRIEDGEGTLSLGYNYYNSSTGEGLFYDCPLEALYLGRDLSYNTSYNYAYSPFYNKRTLTSVTIGNSVTSIGSYAFYGCSGLTSIEIPNSVTSIGSSAFYYCSGLTSVEIPSSVTSIEGSAFYGCSGLTSVHISYLSAWCNIDFSNSYANPLYYAKNLYLNDELVTELVIPDDVTEIKDYSFINCTAFTNVIISNSVTSVGVSAFQGCDRIKNLYIGKAIENIDYYAFADCNNLLKIKISAQKAISANENIFSIDAYNNARLCVPIGRKFAYEKTSPWEKFHIDEEMDLYTVKFIVDGEIYTTLELQPGDSIPIPEPAKKGYTFNGWGNIPATMPMEDIIVEGSFSVNTYMITYLVDGEVFATDSIAYGSEVVLIEDPTKEGYTFSGWSEVPETMPAEDITVEGTFIEDVTTGVEEVEINNENVEIYNLKGERIINIKEQPKGIYIINGKKVFVK